MPAKVKKVAKKTVKRKTTAKKRVTTKRAAPKKAKPKIVAAKKTEQTIEQKKRAAAVLKFFAPEAKHVCIAGTFNNWDTNSIPMAFENGEWATAMELEPGRYEYKFIVDGNWITDPNSQQRTMNEHGSENSILEL